MKLVSLIKWSQTEFTDLPWRKNRSLYRTLVSEIMLQQTTVSTVKNHFERFLKRFPDLDSLARASEEELLIAWKGLGYYRRARNLKKIAETLVNDYEGKFPKNAEALQKISGIGPYTSNALMSIGMDRSALAVDANLERVIARLYGLETEKGLKLQKEIQQKFVSEEIFGERNVSFRALNEALMDLGRTYCQARKASCELCPMKKDCVAFKKSRPLFYPVSKESSKKAQEHEIQLLRVFVVKKGKVLVYKKEEGEWLTNQYEVPTLLIHSTDSKLKQYPALKDKLDHEKLLSFKSGITKYKITNFIYLTDEKNLKKIFDRKVEWKTLEAEDSNLSTTTMKAIAHLKRFHRPFV